MSTISIRIDDDLKKQLQKLTEELGMDMTTFFTMAAKQAVREQALPFLPGINVPNAKTLAAFDEVENMKVHPEQYKSYGSFREFMKE